MDVPPRDLSLDEFIVEMSGQPVKALTHERLMHLAGRLRLSHALVGASVAFSRDGYARNLVCRTSSFELLVLCWRPGQESTIHDHAGALNAIRVYSGELTSRTFTRTSGAAAGDGPVAQDGEERVPADGHMVGLDRNGIHQLANTSGQDLVTVHVYAPALMELNVYSTTSAEVERRPLRYTLADDLA
ncbi:MAG TPA: cysteine dioxygenase family protein [Thermoleophilia bacterium]|nr:cysteine dioxygenase family protein [Thermoleophilia bacterium]